MRKKVNILEFLREILIENNFVTLSPYLGYHINLTRALSCGISNKKAHLYSSWEGTHTKIYSLISFVSSYDERTNDFTLKGFNSYKLSPSTSDYNNKKKRMKKTFFCTEFNNGWISYHDTYLHRSHHFIHWYCSFFPILFSCRCFSHVNALFALFVSEDDLLEWLWHVVIIMKKPRAISTLCCRVRLSSWRGSKKITKI